MTPFPRSLQATNFLAIAAIAAILVNWPLGCCMSIAQETSDPSKPTASPWSIEPQAGKLILKHRGVALTVFHYQVDQCLRPFFSIVLFPSHL